MPGLRLSALRSSLRSPEGRLIMHWGATFPPKKPSQPCKRTSNRSSTKANKPLGEAGRAASRFSTPLRGFQQVSTSAFQVGRGSRRSNLEESFQTDIDSSASAHQQRVEKKKLK